MSTHILPLLELDNVLCDNYLNDLDQSILGHTNKYYAEKYKNIVDNIDLYWSKYNTKSISDIAAKYGYINILEWFHENGYYWDNNVICKKAAKYNQIEVIRWLCNNDYVLNEFACHGAAAGGHIELLNLLHECDCGWDEKHVLMLLNMVTLSY